MPAISVICLTIALLFAFAAPGAAQTSVLEARVTDPAKAVVVGAAVVLTHQPTGAQQTSVTGDQGVARFTGLTPGPYRLEIAARSFDTHVQTLTLAAGDRTIEATLTIAAFQEDVTVEGVATVPTIGRVSTPLRDQPMTVHTLTSEFLRTYAVNDVVTALKYVPNVTAYNQYGVYQYFTFRGISDNVQLVDGIRNEGNRVNTQLANVERLEILKGPASVLYGGDAIGGTVNIVLKKPSPDPVYDFSATAGRWDTYRGSLGATGRLGTMDQVFYRFDVGGDSAENFRHDPSRRLNVTPSVSWRMTDAARFDVRYMFDRNRVSGDSGIPLVPLTAGFVPDPARTAVGDPLARAVQGDGSDMIPKVARDVRFNTPQDFGLGSDHNLRVSYSQIVGRLAVRNTVGYRRFNDEYWLAEFLDVTPPSRVNRGFLYFNHHRNPLANQAELSGQVKVGVPHDFVVGYDYQHHGGYTNRRAAANFNTTPMDLYDPVETHVEVDLDGFPVTRRDYSRNITNGVFFQDTMTLVPQLKFVVGARFDKVQRKNYNNPVTDGVETDGPVTRSESEKGTHRVGLVYQPAQRIDIYAQNSTSFKPNFSINLDGTPLLPEYGKQFEVGQRLRMMQGRLELTTAAFHIVKRNLTRSLGGGRFEQIGKLRTQGLEAEVSARLTSRWGLSTGYGFVDAEFQEFFSGTTSLAGRTPRRVPDHTFNVSTWYAWANGISVNGGVQSVSPQYINDTNTVRFSGYGVVNLGAAYTKGRLDYRLNLTNLTDTEYWASSLGNRQLYPGQPFNVLATVSVRTN
jgi:iron complex outermembrane recepter protein